MLKGGSQVAVGIGNDEVGKREIDVRGVVNRLEGFVDAGRGIGDGNEIFLSPGSATLGDVPEPGTLVLLSSGALSLAGVMRRRLLP